MSERARRSTKRNDVLNRDPSDPIRRCVYWLLQSKNMPTARKKANAEDRFIANTSAWITAGAWLMDNGHLSGSFPEDLRNRIEREELERRNAIKTAADAFISKRK